MCWELVNETKCAGRKPNGEKLVSENRHNPDRVVGRGSKTKPDKTVALTLDREGGGITDENIPYRRIRVDLGPLYLDPEFFEKTARLKTIIVQTRARDDAVATDLLRDWAPGMSNAGFDLVHVSGPAATEASGAVTASIPYGGRGGTVFARGEAIAESYWELVTGSRAAVLALVDRFPTKDEGLLSSYPDSRLPLEGGGEGGLELGAFLEARGRPHGFSIVFGVEERTGRAYSDPDVETFPELTSRKESGAERKRIDVKQKRAEPELLSL